MNPQRIQRKRTKGWRMPANSISVTRPGKWGNPFRVVKEDGRFWAKDGEGNYWGNHVDGYATKEEAALKTIECFSGWIDGKIGIKALDIKELTGKNLACFCKIGEACHADVLLKLANERAEV